jgi:hypothetical protein
MDLHFGPLLIYVTVISFLFLTKMKRSVFIFSTANKWPVGVSWNIFAIIEADK